MNLKQYLVLIAGIAITYIYSLFKSKSAKIAELQSQVSVTKTETELNALKKESDDAHVKSENATNDYNALKLIDNDLANKLGIGPNTNRDKTNN